MGEKRAKIWIRGIKKVAGALTTPATGWAGIEISQNETPNFQVNNL